MRSSIKPLAALLCVAGLFPLVWKVLVLKIPLLPERRAAGYRIEARVSFEAVDTRAQITLQIPKRHGGFEIRSEKFESGGFSVHTFSKDENRKVRWSRKRAKGSYDLFYEASVNPVVGHRIEGTDPPGELVPVEVPDDTREAASGIFESVKSRTAHLNEQIPLLLRTLREMDEQSLGVLVPGSAASPNAVERALRRVLNIVGIPAQRVRGFNLESTGRNPALLSWLEVWDGRAWKELNVRTGEWGVPSSWFAWWRGNSQLLDAEGVSGSMVTFAVSEVDEESSAAAVARSADRHWVPLYTLPAEIQSVYRIILLIPVGGLIIVILRNIIGMETFGTFMPVLIALAFRETKLLWGLVLFVLVVGIGLIARFYFERLKLLLVPRLAATLTVVIILLVLVSAFATYLGMDRGPSVALFPMVIMTMAIERMSVQWEESGPLTALRLGLMTLGASMLVYFAITDEDLAYMLFTFPELLLLLLTCAVVMGRYTGYRLVEGWRFRSLASGGTR